MDRDRCWQLIDGARIRCADELETLTEAEWTTPSWCAGWTVRDVGAHLSLAGRTPVFEVLRTMVESRGRFDAMIDTATRRRAERRSNGQIMADLRGLVGSRRLAPFTVTRDALLDLLVHTQDAFRPLGRRVPADVDGALVALTWAWQRRFPFFPARRLGGLTLVATDQDYRRGQGPELRGPVLSLLLLSTGRAAALADLEGPGAALLAARATPPAASLR
ncbi:MAG: hypothetical protein JWP61_431 [Friedmanniella sp.]|nr:hypothetical protein [Friedmanniella sp.]